MSEVIVSLEGATRLLTRINECHLTPLVSLIEKTTQTALISWAKVRCSRVLFQWSRASWTKSLITFLKFQTHKKQTEHFSQICLRFKFQLEALILTDKQASLLCLTFRNQRVNPVLVTWENRESCLLGLMCLLTSQALKVQMYKEALCYLKFNRLELLG